MAARAVKIIIGLAAGVYAVLQVRQLTQLLERGDRSAYATGGLFGCVAGLCLGVVVCVVLLRSAFKRTKSSP